MKTIILIAMLRTVNEGGALQRDFTDMDACLSFGVRLEQRAVGVKLLRAQENLQVPGHVPKHESHEPDARDCHDPLFANRRIPELQQRRHRFPLGGSSESGSHRGSRLKTL